MQSDAVIACARGGVNDWRDLAMEGWRDDGGGESVGGVGGHRWGGKIPKRGGIADRDEGGRPASSQ